MMHRMNVEEMPTEFGVMNFDRWTGSYRDNYNDIFVAKLGDRKMWQLTERGPGNRTIQHSCHRSLEKALTAANSLCAAKRGCRL